MKCSGSSVLEGLRVHIQIPMIIKCDNKTTHVANNLVFYERTYKSELSLYL